MSNEAPPSPNSPIKPPTKAAGARAASGKSASLKAAGNGRVVAKKIDLNAELDFSLPTQSISPPEVMQKLVRTAREAAREAVADNKARILEFASGIDSSGSSSNNSGVQADFSPGSGSFAPAELELDADGLPIGARAKADLGSATAGNGAASLTSSVMSQPDDGIEILCQMAEKGEIDPKNVDIIDVCDKFLKAIASTPKESLRMSGKVIFHAAVLLRLKAEALLSEANSAINPVVDDFLDFDDEGGPIIYDSNKQEIGRQLTFKDLEGAIVRRAQRKQQVRERRVTLDQLIAALKEAEKLETVRHEKKPKHVHRIDLSGYNEVNDVDDILDLAHDEDIEGTIVRVEQWIAANLVLGDSIEFLQLVIKVSVKQDWVEAFLAALFLSNAGKIDLAQEEFYGPLYLSLCQGLAQNTTTTEVGDTIANGG